MKLPFTRKMLLDWAGPRVFEAGRTVFEKGSVIRVRLENSVVEGEIAYGNKSLKSKFRIISDGTAENMCPCYDSSERGIICLHVIALGLELVRRNTDPLRGQKALEEERRAARLAKLDESAFIKRVSPDVPGAVPACLRLALVPDWKPCCLSGGIRMKCFVDFNGAVMGADSVPRDLPLTFSRQDENLLYVLEDICAGPMVSDIDMQLHDFSNVLKLCAAKQIYLEDEQRYANANAAAMCSVLKIKLNNETGELILNIHTELPFADHGSAPVYILSPKEGWVYQNANFWPLDKILPVPFQQVYSGAIKIGRASVPQFLRTELGLLEQMIKVETDVSVDILALEPAEPGFRLVIRGSAASIAATLYAEYGAHCVVAGKPDPSGHFTDPDPDDVFRYTTRNMDAEKRAIRFLSDAGFACDDSVVSPIVGGREVLNFLANGVSKLRRLGWKIEMAGPVDEFMNSLDVVVPVVRVEKQDGADWFEVGFEYEDATGESLTDAEIQRAILKEDFYIEKNGRTILVDADAIVSARTVFQDCAPGEGSAPGTFRLNDIYSGYVKASLDSLDGIDVECTRSWRDKAERLNKKPEKDEVTIPPRLEGVLRPYQKDGVAWLRFLECNRFCGILADDMGLGKTLQALVWINMGRMDNEIATRPALIVCPTSLVDNWREEAGRFMPDMKVLVISGAARHGLWDSVPDVDMVVTSYALMRRDVENYVKHEFSAIILDEAQHIKNKSTQNAQAAKQLKGYHRLVLTGTPIENSVADLWSIMDFLMPGYLGSYDSFKLNYELPITHGSAEGERAQAKLKRKLHPFLLRRLKSEVARDLPPKIQKIASCSLTRDQQAVYRNLLESSQRKINDMVSAQGFNKSRMEILKTLMRLRQTCCHLGLLKLQGLESQFPSGKMDLFFELLNEAIDGGHKIIVFSQFTSMLAILRDALESDAIRYSYLDGATKERQKVVAEFNSNKNILVFLMSLKAGGTGLNITGADMVIHFDPWWNPAVEDQATDRAHRIGQKKTVYSVKLITRGTVEEKVLEMQRKKQSIIDATLSSDEAVMTTLTWDDVQELLSL